METLINPFAPPAYNGLNPAAPDGYVDVDFEYVFDIVLTGNENLPNQSQPTVNDSDFAWRAVIINTATGTFSVRFSDSQGYQLSQGYILNGNLQGDASSPYPIFPEIIIPAGGKIGIDLIDTSGGTNTIEIGFRGVRRYRIA